MAVAQSLDALHRSKANSDIRKTNRFQVNPKDINFLDGFNTRDYEREETVAHIRALADAYLAGDYVPPIIVKVIDGVIYVLEGHCRTLAMRKAIEEGADLSLVGVDNFRGSELEADALVLTSNQTLELTALERAKKYQHMANRGASASDIARMVKKTTQHVNDYLAMHEMPDALKALIHAKEVSPTEALARYKEVGTKAADEIKAALDQSGKKRVTSRDIDKVSQRKSSPTRVNKRVVTAMVGHFRSLGDRINAVERREDGSATLELSREEIDAFLAMRSQLPEEQSSTTQDAGESNTEGNTAEPSKAKASSS